MNQNQKWAISAVAAIVLVGVVLAVLASLPPTFVSVIARADAMSASDFERAARKAAGEIRNDPSKQQAAAEDAVKKLASEKPKGLDSAQQSAVDAAEGEAKKASERARNGQDAAAEVERLKQIVRERQAHLDKLKGQLEENERAKPANEEERKRLAEENDRLKKEIETEKRVLKYIQMALRLAGLVLMAFGQLELGLALLAASAAMGGGGEGATGEGNPAPVPGDGGPNPEPASPETSELPPNPKAVAALQQEGFQPVRARDKEGNVLGVSENEVLLVNAEGTPVCRIDASTFGQNQPDELIKILSVEMGKASFEFGSKGEEFTITEQSNGDWKLTKTEVKKAPG